LRLADSLPREVVKRARLILNESDKNQNKQERLRKYLQIIEDYADKGYGSCLLKDEGNAIIFRDTLLCQDATIYSWVIMPNHVHFLMKRSPAVTLSEYIKRLKQVSTYRINARLGKQGPIWLREYYDRYMRTETHFERAKRYIKNNPIKAGLVKDISDWPWYGELSTTGNVEL